MNQKQIDTVAPVVKSIHVNAPPLRAFEIFTAGMGRWWPKAHHIGACDFADIIVEPRAGGRFFERGEDGSECEWGRVIVFQPGEKLMLGWQLNADWEFDPDFEVEVDVTFTSSGDETLVRLEHRQLERYGRQAVDVRASISGEGGWSGILGSYSNCCAEEYQT